MRSASYQFRTLGEMKFRQTEAGSIQYSVGNSAIIFCASINNKLYSVKCYTAHSERLKTIYGTQLLEQELYIPSDNASGVWLDVLLTDWIEGDTLGNRIKELVQAKDIQQLTLLSENFDRLALELLQNQRAHGDITCENIIVDRDNNLHLIDFDGSFTPELAGEQSIELGTQAYQHPRRTSKMFNSSIDDYSLAIISTALAVTALEPEIYNQFWDTDGLLYTPLEMVEGRSKALETTMICFAQKGKPFAYAIAKMLTSLSPELPNLAKIVRLKSEGVDPNAAPTSIFYDQGAWGYLNEFGRETIPPIFGSAISFRESRAAVKLGESWHYIDNQCRVVINCHGYDRLKSFHDGCGRAQKDGEWVEVNENIPI